MNIIELLREKIDGKVIKKIMIRFVCLVYVYFITTVVTKYSSNILIPDLFDNERATVDGLLFVSLMFMAIVLFFKEKSIVKYLFIYHFVMIFTVLTVIMPFDIRPIIFLPMILALIYDKSIGYASVISVCAYNVFTLSDRPDNIVYGPEFMMIIVMLIIGGVSVLVVDKNRKIYFDMIFYIGVYCLNLILLTIFGSYCKDYPGCEIYYENSFKFYASKGVLISIVIILIFKLANYIFYNRFHNKRKILEISSSEYSLIVGMKKNSIALYNHSIEVAELSALAAKSIGCDEDIAFAGGLYHDIGKMSGTNYVHEGVKIAGRYKFPNEIKNIIIEHNVKNRLPKSKEAAIVMLADTAVSAVEYLRTNKKTVDEVTVFENSLLTRLKNGALNDSGMTIYDFNTVKDIFMQHKALNFK